MSGPCPRTRVRIMPESSLGVPMPRADSCAAQSTSRLRNTWKADTWGSGSGTAAAGLPGWLPCHRQHPLPSPAFMQASKSCSTHWQRLLPTHQHAHAPSNPYPHTHARRQQRPHPPAHSHPHPPTHLRADSSGLTILRKLSAMEGRADSGGRADSRAVLKPSLSNESEGPAVQQYSRWVGQGAGSGGW